MSDATAKTAMRVTSRGLAWLLVVIVQALSFDALRHRAMEAGIVHGTLLFGRVSEHMLDGAWALTIDVLLWIGILGVRVDHRDWRSWMALGVGLWFTFGFQVWQLWPSIARAVPPVALAVALAVVEIPRRTHAVAAEATPVGERATTVHAEPTPATLTPAQVEQVRRRKTRPAHLIATQTGLPLETVQAQLAKWAGNGRPDHAEVPS